MWAPEAIVVTVSQLPFHQGEGCESREPRACSEWGLTRSTIPPGNFCDL